MQYYDLSNIINNIYNPKPTRIDVMIPYDLNYPYSQKTSYFIGLNVFHSANIIINLNSTLSKI